MLTAVIQRNRIVVTAAVELPAVRKLDPAAILALMQADAALSDPFSYHRLVQLAYCDKEGSVMDLLYQLPAARQVALEDILPMLESALDNGNCTAVAVLCVLPATSDTPVKDISLPDWARLMAATVNGGLGHRAEALCRVTAAERVDRELLALLLAMAVLQKQYYTAFGLCGLPAAKDIPPRAGTAACA